MAEQPEDERPRLILCDWAEEINGKLYIQGADFDHVLAGGPAIMSIVVLWRLPWHRANQQQHIRLHLVTEDGEDFTDNNGNGVDIQGAVEVGRPPGMKPGSSLSANLALKLPPLTLPVGGYRFEFSVNDTLEATYSLVAAGGGPQP